MKELSKFEWLLKSNICIRNGKAVILKAAKLIKCSKIFDQSKLVEDTVDKLKEFLEIGCLKKEEISNLMNRTLSEKEIIAGIDSLKSSKVHM